MLLYTTVDSRVVVSFDAKDSRSCFWNVVYQRNVVLSCGGATRKKSGGGGFARLQSLVRVVVASKMGLPFFQCAIFCDTFFVVIFRKNACFLVNRKRRARFSSNKGERILFVSRLKAKRRELATKAGWFFDGRDVDERRSESVREQRNVIRRGALCCCYCFFSIARDLNLLN